MNGSGNAGSIGGKPFPSPQRKETNCSDGRKSLSPCGQKASWRETTANITENAPPISQHWEKQRKPEVNGMPSRLPWQSTWKPIPGAAPSAGKWRPSECGIRGINLSAWEEERGTPMDMGLTCREYGIPMYLRVKKLFQV